MSLYSHRHVKIRLTRRERLWSCVILFESLLRCWAILCVAQHRENCHPTSASFFQGQPAPAAARTAALRSGRQADPIPVSGSTRTSFAQHKYCFTCWLFWAAHGSAWKWKEAQSRKVRREELVHPSFFWNHWASSLLVKENFITVIIYRCGLRMLLKSIGVASTHK